MRKTSLPEKKPRPIALLGGKFDPPHLGHQLMIFLLLHKLGMHQVWLIPRAAPPFGYPLSPFRLRYKMCHLLALPWRGRHKVRVLDDEKKMSGSPVYTVTLVRHLIERYGPRDYRLVIGEDNWNTRDQWKDFEELARLAPPIVIGRGLDSTLPIKLPDISSTIVREAVAAGTAWEHLVPAGVAELVRKYHLYLS